MYFMKKFSIMIDISHLTKRYEIESVLDDVSLTIARSEVVSIIGHSGSGKSTLLRCIAGLEPYESGVIKVDVQKKDGYEGIGMVFKENNLFPHLTIMQNLVLAPVHVLGMKKEDARELAEEILDNVGIWNKKDEYPASLSSGQVQRAAIARSLMMKPEVLLLDEPTSSLDPVSANEVFNVLDKLKKQGMTIVLVTHNIDFARSISDRIVFMDMGRICEVGTPSELIDHPKERKTLHFINYCVNMVYDIPAPKFDHPQLNARIEDFCRRYRLPVKDTYSAQLVVEELLNLLPLDNGLRLVLSKNDKGLVIEAVLEDSERTYISEEDMADDLSFMIISSKCTSIDETVNESGEKIIRLTLKENKR